MQKLSDIDCSIRGFSIVFNQRFSPDHLNYWGRETKIGSRCPNSSGWEGGHRDWKLGMVVSEFIWGVNAIVWDVSKLRA